MDWSRFNTHGVAATRAFEAFASALFERWCATEYGAAVTDYTYVNGAGGDAGVEAYCTLRTGDILGIQAKWFPDPLGASELRQVRDSLASAVKVRPALTRYVVALPRDLADPRSMKPRGRRKKTERERWTEFARKAKSDHRRVQLELWDDSRLQQLLAAHGSDGLYRYWFDRTMVRHEDIRLRFDQARHGWLKERYTPDVHQVGQIEADLQARLRGPQGVNGLRKFCERFAAALEGMRRTLERLPLYPEYMKEPNSGDALAAAKASLKAISEHWDVMQCVLGPNAQFPLQLPDSSPRESPLRDLRGVLAKVTREDEMQMSPVKSALEVLAEFSSALDERSEWLERLRVLGKPVIYYGTAGAGKTHALANAVEHVITAGGVAYLVRAKELRSPESLELALRAAVGEPSWTLRDILDAVSAATTLHDVAEAAKRARHEAGRRTRALVAFDGIDESVERDKWAEVLGSTVPVAERWPRILFVATSRPSVARRLGGITPAWHTYWLAGTSDAPLDEVFKAYCQSARIKSPPALRWALQTPFGIRLFAEMYAGAEISAGQAVDVALDRLIRKKLDRVESEARERDTTPWPEGIQVVRRALSAICDAALTRGPVTEQEVVELVMAAIRPGGVITPAQVLSALQHMSERGLLIVADAEDADKRTWEPAFDLITDYMLALEATEAATTATGSRRMPEALRFRTDAQRLAAIMLGRKAFDLLAAETWAEDLSLERREDLQFVSLTHAPVEQALRSREWVSKMMTKSMPSARRVLSHLVIPVLRLEGEKVFGAQFVHDALAPLGVAARDLFWSGPAYVPANCGAAWEGVGERVLETIELSADEEWSEGPLLAAWAFTTVDVANRRRLRVELSRWGSVNPVGLLSLLKHMATCNDPQVEEDLYACAHGAASLTVPDKAWVPAAEWVSARHYSGSPPANALVRHYTRAFVVRVAVSTGTSDANYALRVRSAAAANGLADLDREAIEKVNEEWGYGFIDRDLAWYVIRGAYKPFFYDTSKAVAAPPKNEAGYDGIPSTVLSAVAGRTARRDATRASRRRGREELAARESAAAPAPVPLKITIRRFEDLEAPFERQEHARPIVYSPAATALLSEHASVHGLPMLRPGQFAFGFVTSYVRNLGWNENQFRGEPNGGKPGEVLGADVAIMREYWPASHGERSETSTFAEKYVWLGVHALAAFLADRLPAEMSSTVIPAPVDCALLVDAPNPASDVHGDHSTAEWSGVRTAIAPALRVAGRTQRERAARWVKKAPRPRAASLLVAPRGAMSGTAAGHEWLALHLFARERDDYSQGEGLVWASGVAFPTKQVDVLLEDARHGWLPDLHEAAGSIEGIELYVDPIDAVWAPWVWEDENVVPYRTVSRNGDPATVIVRPCVTKGYWRAVPGESSYYLPSKWLRRLLGIVDGRRGVFTDATGAVVAFWMQSEGSGWRPGYHEVLFARADLLRAKLRGISMRLGWGLRVLREPCPELVSRETPRADTVFFCVDGPSSIQEGIMREATSSKARRRSAS